MNMLKGYFTRPEKMILYDASYIRHVASKEVVTGKVTEYFHIRPNTFLKRKILYLIVAYSFKRQVAYSIR